MRSRSRPIPAGHFSASFRLARPPRFPPGTLTAVDGGTVVDGSATFRAGMRFKLVLMLSTPQPQMAGYIRAVIKAAKASTTFYVDPLITLS